MDYLSRLEGVTEVLPSLEYTHPENTDVLWWAINEVAEVVDYLRSK